MLHEFIVFKREFIAKIAPLDKINQNWLILRKQFIMTTADLKFEIKKAIDEVPESVLVDILDYLKQVKAIPKEKIELSRHLGLIIREDRELLRRLALWLTFKMLFEFTRF